MEKCIQNYYKVVAKCGHVGRKNYIPIQFAIIAENGKEAARIAKKLPRVKRDHKDAILLCEKISYEDYTEILKTNNSDPYLKCKNIQEQERTCSLDDRLVNDFHQDNIQYDKEDREARIRYKTNKFLRQLREDFEDYEYIY